MSAHRALVAVLLAVLVLSWGPEYIKENVRRVLTEEGYAPAALTGDETP